MNAYTGYILLILCIKIYISFIVYLDSGCRASVSSTESSSTSSATSRLSTSSSAPPFSSLASASASATTLPAADISIDDPSETEDRFYLLDSDFQC